MNDEAINTIVNSMSSSRKMRDIQYIQTTHRLKLASFWDIQPGMNILEIGCGQGDMTATLAFKVGEMDLFMVLILARRHMVLQ